MRAVLATAIPFAVGGVGPWLLLDGTLPATWTPWRVIALVPMTAGLALLTHCIMLFARVGHGTLAPVDAPAHFVFVGPYRWTRNPMYVGVALWLLGAAVFAESARLGEYAAVVVLGFHAFVKLYEEPRLRAQFGSEYDAYVQRVPRWLGRRRGTR